jgi:hypothetical protein
MIYEREYLWPDDCENLGQPQNKATWSISINGHIMDWEKYEIYIGAQQSPVLRTFDYNEKFLLTRIP